MKATPVRLLAFIALVCLPGSLVRGDAAAHAQLIKERDTVLSQILAQEESKQCVGACDADAIFAAKLALCSFRRDVATSKEEKLKNQQTIVGLYERKLELSKSHAAAGVSGPLEVLRATDALLAEKLILEELNAGSR